MTATPFQGELRSDYAVQIDKGATPNSSVAMEADIRVGDWDAGFCDCFQHCVPNCLMSCCCPCVSMGQVTARLGLSTCFTGGVLFLLAMFIGIPYYLGVWYVRSEIRRRYLIPGNSCEDCLAACCCNPCTVAQMATHVKSYKPGSCDMDAPDTLLPYNH